MVIVVIYLRTTTAGLILMLLASPLTMADDARLIDFENDLQPVLTRFGCTSGPCHGKARGQGGFQLSLLGFDADFDYEAIIKEGRGRRVFPAAPEKSLLLTKPTAEVAHGGGKRFEKHSTEYQMLLDWIRQGMIRKVENSPSLQTVKV